MGVVNDQPGMHERVGCALSLAGILGIVRFTAHVLWPGKKTLGRRLKDRRGGNQACHPGTHGAESEVQG